MTRRARPVVIGGAGFIGSALVRTLLADGPVRVLDDFSTGSLNNLAGLPGVEVVEGSILDAATTARALQGAGVVYHLACLGVRHSIEHPFENHAVNALGTLNALEAARRAGAQRFVYVSTSEVYGTASTVPMAEEHPTRPHTVYGAAKLAGESYARSYALTYGFPTVVIRPFNAFGPRSHHEGDSGEVIPKFVIRAMNGLPPVVFGDGQQTRDFTFVDDTARAISAAGVADGVIGETINVGSTKEITVNELAQLILRVTGREHLEPIHHDPRPGDVLRLHADSRRAEELLGWRPQVGLADGIAALLSWHREVGTDWNQALTEDVTLNWKAG